MNRHQRSGTKRAAMPTTRCAIYCRKSSEEGLRQEFNSLDAQRVAAEAYVTSQQSKGFECSPTRYDDGGLSGGTLERPALKRLIADIENGLVDAVVCYKIDRLSRSLSDFMKLMALFEKHEVAFISVTQAFDTGTPMGRLTMHVLLSFAEFEREVIGERIRDKIAASRQRGKWTGGTPILGYDVDRSGPSPRLVVNPKEAARVVEIFDLYFELGALLPVVAELERRGWRNKAWTTRDGRKRGGLPFDKCRLHDLLTNVVYIGKVRHKDHVYAGEHDAIVLEDVFERVQRQLKKNCQHGNPELRNKHGSLLRGLLFCKACQRAMTHTFTTRGSRRYAYHTCTAAVKRGRRTCPTPSLPALAIENAVVDQIRCIAQDADVRNATLRQARLQVEAAVKRLTDERRSIERGLKRLQAGLTQTATAKTPPECGASRLTEISEQILASETRLTEIDAAVAEQERELVTEADVAAAFDDFDGVWKALSPREQAQVVRLLVARVEFDAAESAIEMTFHPTGIKALADKARANAEEAA